MFRTSFRLPFRLAGIPLFVDVSFLLVLPLMVWATARNIAGFVHSPQLGLDLDPAAFHGSIVWALGVVSVIGLFASIVLHELGHSITAQRYGVKVRRITLWFLGGVAEFEEMPRQRGAEAVVGIAGPIVSFVLAVLFMGATALIPRHTYPAAWIVVGYLGAVNLMLGLFNLLPALPLDGGRILRSLLALKMPHLRATMIAGNIAKVIAVGMGIYGLLVTHNLWMLVLAFFVFNAANAEGRQAVVVELLRGFTVSDLMNRDVRSVPARATAGELSQYVFMQPALNFPVVDETGRVIGTVGVEQLRDVHPETPVWRVMSTQVQTIAEGATALDAFKEMGRDGAAGLLIVLDEAGRMADVVTQADLTRAIQARMLGFQAVQGTGASPIRGPGGAGTFAPYSPAALPGYTGDNGARDPERYARPL